MQKSKSCGLVGSSTEFGWGGILRSSYVVIAKVFKRSPPPWPCFSPLPPFPAQIGLEEAVQTSMKQRKERKNRAKKLRGTKKATVQGKK